MYTEAVAYWRFSFERLVQTHEAANLGGVLADMCREQRPPPSSDGGDRGAPPL
jgi:hypothetical protein